MARDPLVSITIAPKTRPSAYTRYRGTATVHYKDVDKYPLAIAERYMGGEPGENGLRSKGRTLLR